MQKTKEQYMTYVSFGMRWSYVPRADYMKAKSWSERIEDDTELADKIYGLVGETFWQAVGGVNSGGLDIKQKIRKKCLQQGSLSLFEKWWSTGTAGAYAEFCIIAEQVLEE